MSTALLGGSLSRFSQEESNVISLVPQEKVLRAIEEKDTSRAGDEEKPKRSESPAASSTAAPRSTAAPQSTAAPRSTTRYTYWRETERNTNTTAARTSEYQGELKVYDTADSAKRWSTETQVDLFKESYAESADGSGEATVEAADGKKLIAPGTTNLYEFTLENNGNLALDYTISLKVETDSDSNIPLEWRLRDGNSAPLGDWRGYSETAEVMKQAKLDARRQDSYTIEWRWAYEEDADRDKADTELGDLAAKQQLNAKATIIVHAEQDTEQIPDASPTPSGGWHSRPSRVHLWPKTGDTSNLILYIVLMTVSGFGLLILLIERRRRKKKE